MQLFFKNKETDRIVNSPIEQLEHSFCSLLNRLSSNSLLSSTYSESAEFQLLCPRPRREPLIYLMKVELRNLNLFHLLLCRKGCSPSICSGIKSCLVNIPTTGALCSIRNNAAPSSLVKNETACKLHNSYFCRLTGVKSDADTV